MSTEGSALGSAGADRPERSRTELVEFLNDARPTILAADALTYLLRTEPPFNVDLEELVELVAAWADERAAVSHDAVSILYLDALRRCLDAHAELQFSGFDPEVFVESLGFGLARHCPSSEIGGFRAGLRTLAAAPIFRPSPAVAFGAETVTVGGVAMSLRDGQEAAVSRLEHEAYMTDGDFESAFADLKAALVSRAGTNIHATLARIVQAAGRIFNTGRIRQAAALFDYVRESYDRLGITSEGRLESSFAVGSADLNEGLLAKVLNDPAQRDAAASVVRLVGYLSPTEVLAALVTENRRERRRLLLAAVEAYGPEAYPVLVDHLITADPHGRRWYATRNFLYLISRIDPPDDATKRRAVEACGRYVTHDQPQLRAAALAGLRRIGGRDVVPFVVRALEPAAYAPGSIDDAETLKRHLYCALETIVETGNEAAITVAAEIAVGTRGAEFDLGPSLRDEACGALMHAKQPLPRRAALVIANHLSSMCGRRFKLVTGRLSFGLDVHACRMLSALIRSSPEPECREALEHPVLVKVLARSTGELV